MAEKNRQILQHLRTSGNAQYVQENLKIKAEKGEIAIQYDGSGASGTSLWTLAKDGQTAVQFVNKEQVDDMIKHGAVAEVDKIETAVGLADDGTYIKKTGTTYLDSATTVEGEIDALDKALNGVQGQINGMDKAASAADGQVVTTISQVDGKVSETKANVKDLQLGGYAKDANVTGAIASTDTINAALSKLENKANAITISNADGSINVKSSATGTDINVNIKSDEKVIKKDGNGGLYTDIKISGATEQELVGLGANVKEAYKLLDSKGGQLGDWIKIYKDSALKEVYLGHVDDALASDSSPVVTSGTGETALCFIYYTVDGKYQLVAVNVESFLQESEFKDGLLVDNHQVKVKIDADSEKDSQNTPVSFLTVGPDGLKLSGIKDEIARNIAALDYTDTAADGQYVTKVDEANGKISVERANVSDAVLNGYEKGVKPESTVITATDKLKDAIAKLEHQIDNAKAAATTKVVEGTDAGNNMTIVPTTGDDESVTYTVNLTDVASKAALDAEIAARKAVDGQTGQTYEANASANYINAVGSLNAADVQLDAILGKDTRAGAETVFSTENTVAKNISDIKKDLAAFKNKLTLSVNDDDKYIATSISTADSGTTITVSAITKDISASTSTDSAIADSYNVKRFAVSQIKADAEGVHHASGVEILDSGEGDGFKQLSFAKLTIDCGEF